MLFRLITILALTILSVDGFACEKASADELRSILVFTFDPHVVQFEAGSTVSTNRRLRSLETSISGAMQIHTKKGSRPLRTLRPSPEGTFSYKIYRNEAGQTRLYFSESYSMGAAFALGGFFGYGPFHSELDVPIEFNNGTFEDSERGSTVSFTITAGGEAEAIEQIASAFARSCSVTGSFASAQGRDAHEEMLRGMASAVQQEVDPSFELTQTVVGGVQALMFQMAKGEKITVEESPSRFSLKGKGSLTKMRLDFPAQRYRIQNTKPNI